MRKKTNLLTLYQLFALNWSEKPFFSSSSTQANFFVNYYGSSNLYRKDFNNTYHSISFDVHLWYLDLHGKTNLNPNFIFSQIDFLFRPQNPSKKMFARLVTFDLAESTILPALFRFSPSIRKKTFKHLKKKLRKNLMTFPEKLLSNIF